LVYQHAHFSADKKSFQRSDRRSEQQSQSHHEEILGIPPLRCLELAFYHSLGKLPEPESTHEFLLTNQFSQDQEVM